MIIEINIKPRAIKWSDPNIMKGSSVNMIKSYVKGAYLFYIFLAFLISCSENQASSKISWEGDSFYVSRENDEYKIDYSVTLDVTSMEIGARINIFSFPNYVIFYFINFPNFTINITWRNMFKKLIFYRPYN